MLDRLRGQLVRHPVVVDGFVAALLLAIGEAAVATARPGALHAASTAISVALVASAVAIRRPWPAAAAGLVLSAVIVDRVAGGNLSRAGIGWAAVVLVGYSAGAHVRGRRGPTALALLIVAMTLVYLSVAGQKGTAPSEWVWELGFAIAPYGVGRLLRSRRRLHAELEDRAVALTHEREQRERLALSVERARIARELHDVAAHSLSVMVVQAGAARSVLDAAPEVAAGALDDIAATGRRTITDLRRLLGFLEGEDSSCLGGVSRIGDLVLQARHAGLPVDVQITGTARRLASAVDLAAYRVIQEGLTNALRHAAGARTLVLVAYEDVDVRVEVSDDGRPRIRHPLNTSGAGRGLQGMRERVELAGGTITSGPRPGGGWAVSARLPIDQQPAVPAAEPIEVVV